MYNNLFKKSIIAIGLTSIMLMGQFFVNANTATAENDTPDLNPANVSVSCNTNNSTTITWTNPVSEALETYFIYRSKTSGDLGDKIYEYNRLGSADSGKTMSYTDTTATIGAKYYYTVKIKTVGGNISTNTAQYPLTCGTIAELQNQTSKESRDDQITEIKTKAKQLKEDKLDSILAELNELRDKVKEQAAEIKYLRNLTTGLVSVTEKMQERVNNFITYGVDDNTKRLGAGERAAVMYSFKSAFKKLPETETELEDAIKIASGRWPTQRSEQAEADATSRFKLIYKRNANMNNPNDNAAVTVMAYGLRQVAANRNLNSETNGIKIFDNIYGHAPSTTEEWNALQAITYSGATR